jgi:hypothetical protein
MKNNIILLLFIVFCFSGCIGMMSKGIKEIYVIYDSNYISYVGKYNPMGELKIIKEGYQSIIDDIPDYFNFKVYRKPFDRQYWFIGKFLIDNNKDITFIPVTDSNKYYVKKYNSKDLENIKDFCSIVMERVYDMNKEGKYVYFDFIKNEAVCLTKTDDEYTKMFLFAFGRNVPEYLIINDQYGKKLMEEGVILPDTKEIKSNIIWQSWYNYWEKSKVNWAFP